MTAHIFDLQGERAHPVACGAKPALLPYWHQSGAQLAQASDARHPTSVGAAGGATRERQVIGQLVIGWRSERQWPIELGGGVGRSGMMVKKRQCRAPGVSGDLDSYRPVRAAR